MKIKICPNRVLKIMLTIILILTVLHVSQLTIYCIVADEEVFGVDTLFRTQKLRFTPSI
jgi:hypothetical protein